MIRMPGNGILSGVAFTSHFKLLTQWQGPYRVERKMSSVNYLIQRWKKKQTFLLKKCESQYAGNVAAYVEEEEEEDDDFPGWRGIVEPPSQSTFGEQLTKSQRNELEVILEEFVDVFRGKPGMSRNTQSIPRQYPSDRLPTGYLMLTERK